MAWSSTSTRDGPAIGVNASEAELESLQGTGVIGAGTRFGMERFLSVFPITVAPRVDPRVSNNGVNASEAELERLQGKGVIGAGTRLGMERFLSGFPITVAATSR
ncbi:MAG: hypothetical protein ACLPUG_12895 [Acidimicrobiales bacterium]